MSLIVTIFVLVFITELISWIGKSVLLQFVRSFLVYRLLDSHSFSDSQAWLAYQGLFNKDIVKRQQEFKSELLSKKAELLKTSAQDQFAKWAKLRRSVDKGLADLEKLSCVYATLRLPPNQRFNTTCS